MIHKLIAFGIEKTDCIYEYAPVQLNWWDNQNATVIDLEPYQIDENILGLNCCFVPALDGIVERILVFNAIFDIDTESLVEDTLLAQGLVNYLGLADELTFLPDANAYTTDSYQKTSEILEKLLSLIVDKTDVIIVDNEQFDE